MRHGTIPGIYCMTAVAVLGMLLLGGCSKDWRDLRTYGLPIEISPSIGTKATAAAFEAGDSISLYGWSGSASSVGSLLIDNAVYATQDGTSWTAAGSKAYWKDGVTTYYFVGVYPKRSISNLTSDEYTVTRTSPGATDLLVARELDGRSDSNGAVPVPLAFVHMMSRLQVSLSFNTQWSTSLAVSSVEVLGDLGSTVDYVSGTVSRTPGTSEDYLGMTESNGTYGIILFPKVLKEIRITIGGVAYTFNSNAGIALESGKSYALNLVVGKYAVNLGGITPSPWVDAPSQSRTSDDYFPCDLHGSGTASDPYLIANGAQLKSMADSIKNAFHGGINKFTSAHFRLINDIDLNPGITIASDGTCTDNSGAAASPCEWTAVGSMSAQFTGEFDGNGHTVRGVYIDQPSSDYQGLFGVIGSGGEIKDLTVKESFIRGDRNVGGVCGQNDGGTITNCTGSGTVTSTGDYAGGVCGQNFGTITNCTGSGTVTSTGDYAGGVCGQNFGTITNCTGSGAVSGSSLVGGVCGSSSATITYCTSSGTVTSTGSNAGGVCGYNNSGTITNCTGSGAVSGSSMVGGFCGLNDGGTIANCTGSGTVTSTGNFAGGVCGYNNSGTITNCTVSGAVSGSSRVGGVCGYNYGGTIANCTGSGSVSGRLYVGGVCGLNDATITNCYYDSTVYTGSGIGYGSGDAIGLPTATMTSTTALVGSGTYSTMTLLGALNAGAAAYNAASPAPSVKACSWKQTSGKRPELDFTATP